MKFVGVRHSPIHPISSRVRDTSQPNFYKAKLFTTPKGGIISLHPV